MYNYNFDPTKFYLGKLCKRGHDWEGSGQSLRTYRGNCVECAKLAVQKHHQAKKQKLDAQRQQKTEEELQRIGTELISQIDASKFKLGILCINNHDWNSTGKTLRYKCQGSCVECRKLYIRQYYEQNKARIVEVNKLYVHQNPEITKKAKAKYRKAHREELNAKNREYQKQEKVKQRSRENNRKPERIISRQIYWQSPRGKLVSTRNGNKRRAIKKQTHYWHYTVEDLKHLCEKFGNACAFCESKEKLTIDHWIPLSRGGTDVISNLLPACKSCNCRKYANDGKSWFETQPFYSKQKWKRIEKHLGIAVANGQLTLF